MTDGNTSPESPAGWIGILVGAGGIITAVFAFLPKIWDKNKAQRADTIAEWGKIVEKLEANVIKLENRQNELTTQIFQLHTDYAQLKADHKKCQEENAELHAENVDLRNRVDELERKSP